MRVKNQKNKLFILSAFMMLAVGVGVSSQTKRVEAAEGDEYVLVKDALTDYSGQYVIAYTTGGVIFDGSRTTLETLDATSNTVTATFSNDGVNSSTGGSLDPYSFTIEASGTSYTIKSASGNYIGKTADSNGMNAGTSTAYTNTISVANSIATITGSGGAILKYNNASGQTRFRYYRSGTASNQQNIQLYKKSESTPSTPSVIINAEHTTLYLDSATLKSTYITQTVSNSEVVQLTWSVADDSILRLENTEDITEVTALKEGETTVTASFVEGGTTYYSEPISFTVKQFSEEVTVDKYVSLTSSGLDLSTSYISNGSDYADYVADNVAYFGRNISNGASNIQMKAAESSLFNLNPYSKTIKTIEVAFAEGYNYEHLDLYAQNGFETLNADNYIIPTLKEGTTNTYVYDLTEKASKYFSLFNTHATGVVRASEIKVEFEEKFTVQLDVAGGDALEVTSYERYINEDLVLPTATRSGYNFTGWVNVNNEAETYTAGQTIAVTSDLSLRAVWEAGDVLESVKTQSKLGFGYTKNTSEGAKTETTTISRQAMSDGTVNYASVLGLDPDRYVVNATKESATSDPSTNNTSDQLRLYYSSAGTGNKVKFSTNGFALTSIQITFERFAGCLIDWTTSSQTASAATTVVNFETPVTEFYLQNTNTTNAQVRINSISFTSEGDVTTYNNFTNMYLGFAANIPNTVVAEYGEIASAGVFIQRANSLTASIAQGMTSAAYEALVNGDSSYRDIPVSASQINVGETNTEFKAYLTNIPEASWSTEVTAVCYIVVDGRVYFTTETTYSVKTIAEYYIAEAASLSIDEEGVAVLQAVLDQINAGVAA